MAEDLGYSGQKVLVTGAASGMGEATARILGELGAEVHALDRREPKVDCAAFYETDLMDPAAIEKSAAAVSEGRPVDKLFNCAGIAQTFPPVDVMLVNFLGLRHLTEALVPRMPDGAAIANISSGAGIGWQANMENVMRLLAVTEHAAAKQWCEEHRAEIREGYSFSKECIIVWTMMRGMQLATERRMRMNCIAPGPTETGMMPDIVSDMGQEYMDNFPKPLLGRNATPEEQAWPLVFLNSDRANVVNASMLYTDQGFAGGLFTGQVDIAAIMPPEMTGA
jgi:NAD(P)-dependent dehydrogenase (short-subunit alcohol dehydrogenase family)